MKSRDVPQSGVNTARGGIAEGSSEKRKVAQTVLEKATNAKLHPVRNGLARPGQ